MPRTLYLIPEGDDPAEAVDAAQAAGAGEIVVGIPLALAGLIDPAELPLVYTEFEPEPQPEPEPEPPAPDPVAEIRADLDWLINYVVTGEG